MTNRRKARFRLYQLYVDETTERGQHWAVCFIVSTFVDVRRVTTLPTIVVYMVEDRDWVMIN